MILKMTTKRDIDGILLVNKPQGLTSNAVLQQVKRLYKAKKAGHTGSLDPLATGMLPICFGEATKFCQYILDADKCYEAVGLLGIKTNTGDSMGEVIATTESFSISLTELNSVLSQFKGQLKQIPSMFSALKHEGRPLYKYAREGIEIERNARDINIYNLILNQFNDKELALTITCSKGTYIRNLIEDIGEALKVGAHVTKLHRLYTAGFESETMFSLDELQAMSEDIRITSLMPIDRAVNYLPRLAVSSFEANELYMGKIINRPFENNIIGLIRLYENDDKFIGLGELEESNLLKVKRLLTQKRNID